MGGVLDVVLHTWWYRRPAIASVPRNDHVDHHGARSFGEARDHRQAPKAECLCQDPAGPSLDPGPIFEPSRRNAVLVERRGEDEPTVITRGPCWIV